MKFESKKKAKILILVDWYSPGYKAGGIITTMVNLVEGLQDVFSFFVITSDRDLDAECKYPGVETDQWLERGNIRIWYARPGSLSMARYRELLGFVDPDLVLINGIFSFRFAVLPLLITKLSKHPIPAIILPHGMLKASALKFKAKKKLIYLKIARSLNIYSNAVFLSSSDHEADDVLKQFGSHTQNKTISHFPSSSLAEPKSLPKTPGVVRFLFASRIHPMKNLHFLLEALRGIRADVSLSIVGFVDDETYWRRCQSIILELAGEVRIDFLGDVPPMKLRELIEANHFLTLPSKGENFGYAIFESLVQGRPVIISDQTPWRNLKRECAGIDVSLEDPSEMTNALKYAIEMSQETYDLWVKSSSEFARQFVLSANIKNGYIDFFNQIISKQVVGG